MKRSLLSLPPLLIFLTGCSLYRSDDRDNFNQNARQGAPSFGYTKIAARVGAKFCGEKLPEAHLVFPEASVIIVQAGSLACAFDRDRYSEESRAQVERHSSTRPEDL